MKPRTALFATTLTGVVIALAVHAAANGTIITTESTFETGAAPVQGVVTIDECAAGGVAPSLPTIDPLPPQDAIGGSLPAFPGAGAGGLGAFAASTDQNLAGGTFEYTSYTVSSAATVTYSGATTLRVQGDVDITGTVRTAADAAPLTIIAGGSIRVVSLLGAPVTGVAALGNNSPVVLHANGVIELGAEVQADGAVEVDPSHVAVDAPLSAVSLIAHGAGTPDANTITFNQARATAGSGPLQVLSGGGATFTGISTLASRFGDLTLRGFGAGVSGTNLRVTSVVGKATVEAAGPVTLTNPRLLAQQGDALISAHVGDLRITAGTITGSDGAGAGVAVVPSDVAIEAAGGVRIVGDAVVEVLGSGSITVRAFGGDAELENEGSLGAASIVHRGAGPVTVAASGSVAFHGDGELVTNFGLLTVAATGGDFVVDGDGDLRSDQGDLDARASGAVLMRFAADATAGASPFVTADRSVRLVARGGQMLLIVDAVRAEGGTAELLAEDDITLLGQVYADDDITILSRSGSIDLPGVFVATASEEVSTKTAAVSATRSGSVLVETYGGSSAVIDAASTTIRTGDHSSLSGDISLLVHVGGPIESFVLPKTVKLKRAENPAKSSLRVAGFFDTGPDEAPLDGPATLTIGSTQVAANLTPKGRQFIATTEAYTLKIKPQKSGSSRAKFVLTAKGPLADGLSVDGPLTLEFATTSADGRGTVTLEKGAYKLGRKRGALSAPALFPFKAKALHKGAGKDKLLVVAGVATAGGITPQALDVTVVYGGLTFTVPASEFTQKGDVFTALNPPSAPGVSKLVVDYLRETLTLSAKGLDLGALPSGPEARTFSVTLGDTGAAVSVRMAPKGKSFVY